MTSEHEGWTYDPAHGVYWHGLSKTYALPDTVTGEWRYVSMDEFRPGQPSAPSRSSRIEEPKEDGEVEDDVGWGGLMDEAELARATKSQSGQRGAERDWDRDREREKHPAYQYSDPVKYAYGATSRESTPPPKETPKHILRLVVLDSSVLEKGSVAMIDARDGGVQLGRDRCERGAPARVRVKEMEVSKTHAVFYWGEGEAANGEEEAGREGWWIVDLGSTLGTMVRYEGEEEEEKRLSDPKQSSKPYPLRHLSRVSVGKTKFSVHIHPSWPCGDCQLSGGNELRLDDGTAVEAAAPLPAAVDIEANHYAMDSKGRRDIRELKRKREMAALRENLLKPESAPPAPIEEKGREYQDRAAMRRKLHPSSPPPPRSAVRRQNAPPVPPSPTITSQPAQPVISKFASSMMASQGWSPGQGLGKSSEGRATAIEVEMRTEKRGLGANGSKAVVDGGEGDWRRRAKQRRYDELRNL